MKIYAHRGASGLAPENTMAAFYLALEQGADGIELDVHLTKDEKLVVIHDEDIKRTSNGEGLVAKMTYDELLKYDYGYWFSPEFKGEKIPTLKEVLDFISKNTMTLNIEIKTSPIYYNRKTTELVYKEVKESGLLDRVIISSFDHQATADMKEIDKTVKTAALYGANFLGIEEYLEKNKFDFTHPIHECVTRKIVEKIKSKKIGVNVWTVNDKDEALRLQDLGVDAIITNYPEILK